MFKKITVILGICLIVSVVANVYLYYTPRYVENSSTIYVSLHKENITAYEKHYNVTVDGLCCDMVYGPNEWNDTVEVFNPDLNTSFRFKYDSEMLYGFVETPPYGYHNWALTLYFDWGNGTRAVIIEGKFFHRGLHIGFDKSTFISTYNRADGLWEDKKPFAFEAAIGSQFYDDTDDFAWGFEFVFPLDLIGSPTNGSSMKFAYSMYKEEDNTIWEWGEPDDFSTYNNLLFR